MARSLRINYPGAIYHVTCRGNERRAIYRDERDRDAFLKRLANCLTEFQLVLHAYVLMENHFHFLLETPWGNLSEAMRQFNVSYTGYFNRRHQRVGHLYQGRFKAIVVEADSYLLELSRYIHLNPIRIEKFRLKNVKHRLEVLRGYKWSSLRGFLRVQEREAFMTYCRVLEYVGGGSGRGLQAYAGFIEEGIKKGVDRPWKKVVGGVLLGKEGFVAKMQKKIQPREDRERPAIRAINRVFVPKTQIKKVEAFLQKEGFAGTPLGRAILMECWHRYGQLSQAEIGKQMGGVSYSRVSQLRGYLREQRQTNSRLQDIIEKVEGFFSKD